MTKKRKCPYEIPRIHIAWIKDKKPGEHNQDCPICLAAPEYIRRAFEALTGVPQNAYFYDESEPKPKPRKKRGQRRRRKANG